MADPQFSRKSDPKVYVFDHEQARTVADHFACSFSRLKELGPIHSGKKCQMEQEISGISNFPEKRTTSRGEPKFSKRISGKFLFHSILNRNFRKFWSNGTRPKSPGNSFAYLCKPSLVFNSFIAKQWMSFCGEGENGVSRR